MNVDGLPGTSINEVEIPPRDSVFVFVEVTIDPNNLNNPFVVEDDIFFTTNGNQQAVHLAAWGQNAYFHYNEEVSGQVWNNDKPHVLYGITAVGFPNIDSGKSLTINPGTQIYAHSEAVLYVYKSKLLVNGTNSSKVVFQGDRREASFANVPGQWFGIRFAIAQNSTINHAIIKNATAGIYADTAFGTDSITITNTESFNHSFASLFAQGAHINAVNCQFGRAGNNSVALRLGGTYYFNHCTINNYWTNSTRNTPALVLNNYYKVGSTTYVRPILRASINNCIIYGNNDNEVTLDTVPIPGFAGYRFNHCMIKTDQPLTSKFVSVQNNVDPRFSSLSSLKLSASSLAAIDSADPIHFVSLDLEENTRSNPADIGCFEYVP